METKTQKVINLVSANEFEKAISIAIWFKFWDNKRDKEAVQMAHECINHPEFYIQLGKDTEAIIIEGIATMRRVFI